MAKKNTTSDEEIIASLLLHKTMGEAAAAVNLTPRAVYDRMRDDGFMELYRAAKMDVLRTAVYYVNSRLADSIEEIADIMKDKAINPAIRLQAAQTFLKTAESFTNRLYYEEEQVLERKHAEDQARRDQKWKSLHGFDLL